MTLVDGFGRVADDLRVSVTDRCNFRCTYCMPADGLAWMPKPEILTFEEITRAVRVFLSLGVRTVRLTGGEPLLRRDAVHLVEMLAALGIPDLSMTTNGFTLASHADALARAGLGRINVSVDSLLRHRFAEMTRRDALDQVLEGLRAAERAGLKPIKLNAVVIRGTNDDEVVDLARFARETGYDVRFIEFMPLDAQGLWLRDKVLFAGEIVTVLSREVAPLIEIPDGDPRAPATEYRYADGVGKVGFIASVSQPFCLNCNRIRLTADGKLRYCLFAIDETDVKEILRSGAPDEEIGEIIRSAVRAKWEGHEINTSRFVAPPRPMYAIGG